MNGENGFELPLNSLNLDYLNKTGMRCGKDIKNVTYWHIRKTQHYCGRPGTPGIDGSDGGCKGLGGSHGESQFIGLENHSNIAVIKENGIF